MEANLNSGGWTPFRSTTSEDNLLFKTALNGLVGVSYEPLIVATQVVAGVNYHFICNAKGVYPNAPHYAAMINVYSPLQGNPCITSIQRLN